MVKDSSKLGSGEQSISHDLETLYNKYKKVLLSVTTAVVAIIIICIFYTRYSASNEDAAWHTFTQFKVNLQQDDSSMDSMIKELLSNVQSTTVEPWALYYCSSAYFNKRKLDDALNLLTKLESSYSGHFICQNPFLFSKIKQEMQAEKDWKDSNNL